MQRIAAAFRRFRFRRTVTAILLAVTASIAIAPAAAHADWPWRSDDGECSLTINNVYVDTYYHQAVSDVSVFCHNYHNSVGVQGYLYVDGSYQSSSNVSLRCYDDNYCGVTTKTALRSGCHTYWGNGFGDYYGGYPLQMKRLPTVRTSTNSVLCG